SFSQDPSSRQFANRVWADYDSRARDLLDEAVSGLEPSATDDGAAATSGGALAGLHRNELITAFLSGDKETAYKARRDPTLIYVAELSGVFRTYCPAALPPGLSTLIAAQFTNLQALTGSRDEVAREGLKAIAEGLKVLADPGPAMRDAMRRDEIINSATADAQILLNTYPCTGGELRDMFANIADWIKDPALGIPKEQLKLGDVCLAAVGNGIVMRETRDYCGCATQRIQSSRRAGLEQYLRASPQTHWRQINILDRNLNQQLQSCRR
ncbi:MAG: hypothetical protein AAF317_05770, partial [Pseudomonadota bacterium]